MAALTEVRVPDIGDFTDVPVIELLVAVGDTVAAEDPLVVLESDKATMEVPSPTAGVVEQLAVAVGDAVSEGSVLLSLRGADGSGAADTADAGAEADGPPDSDGDGENTTNPDNPTDAGDGDGSPGAGSGSDESDRSGPDGRRESSGDGDPTGESVRADAPPPQDGGSPIYASPSARRTARELGVDLTAIEGSGRKGRITPDDVRAAAQAGSKPQSADQDPRSGSSVGAERSAPTAALAGLPPWPQVDFERYGPVEHVALSRVARIAGPALARNWVTIPHVTQHDRADVTDLEAFRVQTNAAHADRGVKVTMVALLLKACAAALRAFPHFNASLDGDRLAVKRYFHIGFAADTPHGLMVPVIRDVDRKGLLDIAEELRELSSAAREGTIGADDMRGGTFTVSSLGGIGGTAFTPIINAPEVAILGVSRTEMAPVWDGESFRPRLMLPLSLSYDHRVIDGAAAARFTTHLASLLADPRRMLL